jgi:hypothetical protein
VHGAEEENPFITTEAQFQKLLTHFPNVATFRIENARITWKGAFWPTKNTALVEQVFEHCIITEMTKNFFKNTPELRTLRFDQVSIDSKKTTPFTGLENLETLCLTSCPPPTPAFLKRIPIKELRTLELQRTPLTNALSLVESYITQCVIQEGKTQRVPVSAEAIEAFLKTQKPEYFEQYPSLLTNLSPLQLDIRGTKTPKKDRQIIKKLYKTLDWAKTYCSYDPLSGKLASFLNKFLCDGSHTT